MAEKQQDIHTGMKMTEAGWIPEDWVCKQIGTIGYTYNGITGKTKSDFGVGNARYITFLNILNNPQIDTKIFERVNITDKDGQNAVIKGDLFFNTSSETPEEVGICSTLTEEVQNVYLNSFCFGFRLTDKELDGLYLSYYFRSHNGRALMTMLAQGATRYNLSKENFNKSYIGVPSTKNEQHRIAQVLSDIDALIASLSRTIEKKRLMKQGAMQQLLTGKTRIKGFKGEWVEKELGEIGELTSAGVDKTIKEDESSIRLLNFLDVYNRDRIYSRELTMWVTASEMKVQKCDVRCGDIFLTPSSEMPNDVGRSAVAMQDIPDACYSYHILRLRPYERLDLYYSAYMLKTPEYEQQIRSFSEGSGKRYVISLKNFREMHIRIPSDIREQETIGLKLATMDNEIESLEIELQKYKVLKQGMMQKLLTGQIRLSYGKES
ncbi:MAG: restriction endonuclease subunit S [Prevotellaceae bacterium]|nr:restriction endonuclease subunit S [Candidatus Faecinaster equi]